MRTLGWVIEKRVSPDDCWRELPCAYTLSEAQRRASKMKLRSKRPTAEYRVKEVVAR